MNEIKWMHENFSLNLSLWNKTLGTLNKYKSNLLLGRIFKDSDKTWRRDSRAFKFVHVAIVFHPRECQKSSIPNQLLSFVEYSSSKSNDYNCLSCDQGAFLSFSESFLF